MTGTTERAVFDELRATRRVVPVSRVLFADGETPVGVYRKLAGGRPGTFLLESAEQGGIWSRWSFVGVTSSGVLTQTGDESVWLDTGLPEERAFGGRMPASPLDAVAALNARWSSEPVAGTPPLAGGLVGFIGWEAVRELERLPHRPPAEHDVPGQALTMVSDLVVLDHREGTVELIAIVLDDDDTGDDAGDGDRGDRLWSDAQHRLDAMQAGLGRPAAAHLAVAGGAAVPAPVHRTDRSDYLAAVEAAKERIVDGDVFQVVVSQRFELACTADALDVYRMLRVLNPSPYMYLLSLERPDGSAYQVVGSSPEALVKVQAGRVYSHPIAGSRPRGATPDADLEHERELAVDPKERAEHLMLVDLARNDLSRVCRAGSVEVTEFMRVERFSHIMHLVSSVEGDLDDGADAVAVFRATFPAGTLSGAPKPKALEIIDELEPAQRGVYGGAVGYFGFGGDADLAIAIRTATLSDGLAVVQAGGGLVADSDPAAEYQESVNKAAAPLAAVAAANALVPVPPVDGPPA